MRFTVGKSITVPNQIRHQLNIVVALLSLCSVISTSPQTLVGQNKTEAVAPDHQWASWRGPLATGEAPHGKPPTEWSEDKNIRWKVELEGKGHSTPIVWGDYIFMTTAIPVGPKLTPKYSGRPGAHDNSPITQRQSFVLVALDRKDGSVRWKKELHEALPHEGAHISASLASASPVTDGEHVFVSFGSYGVYAVDFDGNVVWEQQLGKMHSKHGHGEGSSPVLHKGKLIVNWDHEEQSFIICLDAKDGSEIWKKNRSEVTSWSTPIVVTHKDVDQIIVPGTERMRAYDLDNGEILWECGGLSNNIVASPVAWENMVFVGSSYEKRAMLAVDLNGAKGDITGTENVVWTKTDLTPYVPSPLIYGGAIYYLRHYQGVMSRVDAKTGQNAPGGFRLRGIANVYASPVAAAGRIYVTGIEGNTCVIDGGEVPRVLAVNTLNDDFYASVAIVGDEIFLRGEKSLYCISEEK